MSASAAASRPGQRDVEGSQALPGLAAESEFESASAKVWRLYESEADKYDTELAETWRGQTDAMLIFTGLFSAVVAAFIIETYKMLLPDSGSATVALLTQLVAQSQQNGNTSVISSAVPVTSTQDFTPSRRAIRINILMFISLFLGLTCALMSTLIQQWAREYLQYSQLSAPPQKRGRVRAYLFQGLTKFQMRRMVESIPVFLHISVFLFFFAFSEFLRTVNDTVGIAARSCFIVLLAAYLILSILPLVVSSSPYQTALTSPLRPCAVFLRFIFRLPVWAVKARGIPRTSFRTVLTSALQHNRSRDLLADTERKASSLDYLALQWLLEDVDEEKMDKFVAGLPALIHSPFITDATVTMGALVADGMLERIGEHLKSSMSSREVSQATSINRAFACVEALDAIFSVLDQSTDNPRHKRAASALVRSSDMFRSYQDSTLALRAACVRALTFRKLIDSLPSPAIGHPSHLPLHISPVALRLQTWSLLSSRLWRNRYYIEQTELQVVSSGYDARSIIVREGHLINFLVLIRDVLSYVERPTLDLTSVWEALETMVNALSITQPTASASARTRFEEVHTDVRQSLYVSNKWGTHEGPNNLSFLPVSAGMENPDIPSVDGLTSNISTQWPPNKSTKIGVTVQKNLPVYIAERYNHLLELMDRVATGLRLMTFLSVNLAQPAPTESLSHPSGLSLRHDQIFTKNPFGALDVLDAFSSALPGFIENTSEANVHDTVEKMIVVDGLFRSINEHLVASVRLDLPEVTRERMSMTSFQVLGQVFTLFEKIPTVRWYQLGVVTVLDSAHNVAFSEVVGNLSSIHAHSTLGIITHVILGHFRLRMAPGQQRPLENLEEQLFILRIYDWLCLGDNEERKRRGDRRQGHPDTNREASSPRYLRNLLANGPLQNLSIMAFKLVLDLEDNKAIPEIAWTTLHKLMNVPGLDDADDAVALDYFGSVRKRARDAVVGSEGSGPLEQLDLLGLLNTVARKLNLPELQMPMPVTPPGTPPGDFIPPNRPGYAPIYI